MSCNYCENCEMVEDFPSQFNPLHMSILTPSEQLSDSLYIYTITCNLSADALDDN